MDHLQRTQAEFTRQAQHFAAAPAIADAGLTARFVAAMAAGPEARILDLACGPGIVTAAIAARAGAVVAFDLTEEMLRKARERCAAAGLANVRFEQGSATDLPFPHAAFDGVVTRLSMHHFADPRAALVEIHRVLKPGGRLVLGDVVSAENPEDSELHNAIEVLRDPSHVRMLPAGELVRLVEAAGFKIEAQASWDTPRGFEEWAGIVDDPARIAPLKVLLHRLARAGEHAGIGLRLADGGIQFVHRWLLLTARRP